MLARTNSKNVKKELVIESPQKSLDAAASEAEVESPVEVRAKPKLIEPIDYENVIVQKKTQILNDGLREMLLFPYDDFQTAILKRQHRYLYSTVPDNAEKEAQSLFVTECIKTYNSDWHIVNYKFEDYSGEFRQLPNKGTKLEKLPVHVYEVDEEADKDEDAASLGSQKGGITKQGWLYKGNMNSAISVTMRSFKRRFFHLLQLGDGSYNLNFYKDEKISKEPKGSIFLDSCMGVVQNNKVRRYAFELKMQDKSSYLLAADSEVEMEEWIATLNKILQLNFEAAMQEKRNGDSHDDDEQSKMDTSSSSLDSYLPEIAKGSRDSEIKFKSENRVKLFALDPDAQKLDFSGIEPEVKPFEEKFGKKILVKCNDLAFNLQSCVAENEEGPTTNVEPFFISLSLFDIKHNRKISSDFHVDLNHSTVRRMLPDSSQQFLNGSSDCLHRIQDIAPESMLQYPKQGIFSVTCPHPEIFLVARIEKVLQGSITHCAEPYMKSSDSSKVAQKVLKNAKQACQRLGQYRMPFAWAARTLFKDASGTLDKNARFSALYKQDSNKLSNEDILKLLADFRKPEKMAKLPVILGNLDITIDNVSPDIPNFVSSSYIPMKQFENSTKAVVTFEVEEFVPCIPKHTQPFTIYNNHLYVYPKHLKYDSQKSFAKARNIAVCIEFKDSDDEDSVPLKCIYGRPGGTIFTRQAFATVLHHHQNPEFYDEVKIELPTQLHEKHHLLFSFYHVSCDNSSKGTTKKKDMIETQVGYSWLQLLKDGRVVTNEQHIPVSAYLPSGYLSSQEPGMSKHAGPEIKWVDGGKPLFKVSTHLVSTIYTQDQHLNNFFHYCQKTESGAQALGTELVKYLKSLHAMEGHVMIAFLPTVLNQLFRVLTRATQEEVAVNATRVIIHIVAQCHEEGLDSYLRSYVKYAYKAEPYITSEYKTVHEELAKSMTTILKPSADFLTSNKLLKYSWFFFEILIKSMAQHLLENGKVKLLRNQRFPASYHHAVETVVNMLMPHITQKYKDNPEASKNANHSLAVFIKRCFTFMDRGFVFKQINNYITFFAPGDPKTLFEFKFEFLRVVCNHEHYIPLNLPMPFGKGRIQRYQDLQLDYSLSDEFCKHHFLVGLLLREVGNALQEFRDICQIAISVLKNLMIKHSFDDRYSTRSHQARIATLYLPTFSLLIENVHRIDVKDISPFPINATNSSGKEDSLNLATANPLVTPQKSVNTLDNNLHKDLFGAISGIASPYTSSTPNVNCVRNADSRGSLISTDSGNSLPEKPSEKNNSLDKNRQACLSGSSVVRCDKLDQSEIRSLLMCFLHILKSMSDDALFTYWNKASTSELMDFFTIAEVCLHQFQYMGKRYIARTGMMHARLQQLSSLDNSLTFSHSYGHSEADVLHQSLLEANIATEVCLTILDTLSLFTMAFKCWAEQGQTDLRPTRASSKGSGNSDPLLLLALQDARAGQRAISSCSAQYFVGQSRDSSSPKLLHKDTGEEECLKAQIKVIPGKSIDITSREGFLSLKISPFHLIAPTPSLPQKGLLIHQRLAHLYDTLHRAYSKVTEVMHTGKRLLGTYFRVAFFGQGFFEDEDGKEYIYKEPKLTSLSEISQRLQKLYSDKFGSENVRMIQDSGKVNPKDLDSKYAYIQVTHVVPYFEEKELQERKTEFERNHNIRRFMFEMPFTQLGKRRGGVEEQCKRRTILTAIHCFPYVKKRIPIMYQHHTDLNPIEVAIDEMSKKVAELRQLCSSAEVDMIKLQLKLQGSVSVQVNAGPLAYARAFLDDTNTKRYPDNKVKLLKEVFRQFVEACGHGLEVNERLIKEDQIEYQEEMKANYREMAKELSEIMHEQIASVEEKASVMPNSIHIFNAISGTPTSTTVHGMPSSSSVA
ncbi:hypothetical protein JRQ81_019349 [Phrynocephalus forsythii]|uniref:Dedicator of cytokinesis protein 9 n=1 Tax=Phrynocephalus forsythii TaxID=171643 RepID=A0A9Q1AY84_9SAUR|nr:hypothetical protein JRQ81_019349 [Phrynocephalus forsythii]